MGMSTHIIGFSPPDETWRKMRAVHDACGAAGIEVPLEVTKYFNFEVPDELGVKVDLETRGCVKSLGHDGEKGFEVDLEALHAAYPHVTRIRFYNSW
jgi:hypothetical protein